MNLEKLLQQQQLRWNANQRIFAEDLVIECIGASNLSQIDANGWLDLICHEVVLRGNRGEKPTLEEYQSRFPELADKIRIQWDINDLFEEWDTDRMSCRTTRDGDSSPLQLLKSCDLFAHRYQIGDLLGRGSNGVVFDAWDVRLKRHVALKRLRAGIDASSEDIDRMRSEAEAIARVRSPYIVQVFDVGEFDGLPYLAMELCRGSSLAKRLDGKPLPPRLAAELVKHISQGLAAAHACRIIHRDLKPANILLENELDWVPKLVDFGLAKLLDSDNSATMTGTLLGTPAYMAPEQAFGNAKHVGPEADIYSIGAILYECLTGGPPFRSSSKTEMLNQVRDEEPVSIRTLQPKTPIDIETIAMKCLHKVPGKRYASAQALADDLDRFLQGHPIMARRTGAVERAIRWRQRNPVVALLLGLSAFLLVTIAVGSTSAAFWLRYERDKALRSEKLALQSEQQAIASEKERRQELCRAYILEARASRLSRQSGQRNFGLTAIRNILKAIPAEELNENQRSELRDEAIASLLLADTRELNNQTPSTIPVFGDVDVDPTLNWISHEDQEQRTVIRHLVAAVDEFKMESPSGQRRSSSRTISPDGHWCVEATVLTNGSDSRLRIWDLHSKQLAVDRPIEFILRELAIDPDGMRCFARGGDDRIHVIRIPSGHEISQSPQRYSDDRTALAISPDGTKMAIAGGNQTAEIVDIDSWKPIRMFPEIGKAYSVAWEPNDRGVYFGTTVGTIYQWSIPANSVEPISTSFDTLVRKMDFSADGRYLAATSDNHRFEICETRTGQSLYLTEGDFLGFGPNSTHYAFLNEARVNIAEILDESIYRVVSHNVEGLTFTQDGQWILTGGLKGMQIFSAADLTMAGTFQTDPCGPIAMHPDGNELISFGIFSKMWRWPIVIDWDARELKFGPPTMLKIPNAKGWGTLEPQYQGRHASFSAQAKHLAIADYRNRRTLWMNLEQDHAPQALTHLNAGRVAISPDGKWIASAAAIYASANVWSTDSFEQVLSLDGPTMVAFSPNNEYLALSFSDVTQLYRTADWRLAASFEAKSDRSAGVPHVPIAFQPHGNLIAYSPNQELIRLVDYHSGKTIANILGAGHGAIRDLQFSPDGTRIAFATTSEELGMVDLHLLQKRLADLTLHNLGLPKREVPLQPSDLKVKIDRGNDFPKPDKWTQYWLQMAKGELLLGNYSDAIDKVTSAIETKLPSTPTQVGVNLYVQRGVYHQLNQDFFAAESDWLAALRIEPENLDAILNLGRLYVLGPAEVRKPKQTLQLAVTLSLDAKTKQDAILLTGLGFFRLGLWYDSIQALGTMDKSSRHYGLAQLFLSKALAHSDRPVDADQAMQEFLKMQDEVFDLSSIERADFRRAKKELAE